MVVGLIIAIVLANTGGGASEVETETGTQAETEAQGEDDASWDHGGGWTGMGADETNDEDGLGIDEIAQGLDEGMAAAGVSTLDLLGFDACLMATYEVASTLAPYADYMVASEELEPGHGWNYAHGRPPGSHGRTRRGLPRRPRLIHP